MPFFIPIVRGAGLWTAAYTDGGLLGIALHKCRFRSKTAVALCDGVLGYIYYFTSRVS